MKKLLFLVLPLLLFCQDYVHAESQVVPFYNSGIVSASFTTDFSTTEDLSGLELSSAQQLRFRDASQNTIMINATVTQVISASTLDVTFSTSANLAGLTIEDGQQLHFIETATSSPVTVSFVVVDHIFH